jgi:hypothetical protein
MCAFFLRVKSNLEENNTHIAKGTTAVGSVRDHIGPRRIAEEHEALERATS